MTSMTLSRSKVQQRRTARHCRKYYTPLQLMTESKSDGEQSLQVTMQLQYHNYLETNAPSQQVADEGQQAARPQRVGLMYQLVSAAARNGVIRQNAMPWQLGLCVQRKLDALPTRYWILRMKMKLSATRLTPYLNLRLADLVAMKRRVEMPRNL